MKTTEASRQAFRREQHSIAPPRIAWRQSGDYFAATTMISTRYWGEASLASTVARAGVLPGDTQLSHTAFISAKFFMSVM